MFTVDEHVKLLHEKFPDQFEVVARHPRFLEKGDVVLLGRRQSDGITPITARRPSQNATK